MDIVLTLNLNDILLARFYGLSPKRGSAPCALNIPILSDNYDPAGSLPLLNELGVDLIDRHSCRVPTASHRVFHFQKSTV